MKAVATALLIDPTALQEIVDEAADLLAAMASSCHGDRDGFSSFDHFSPSDAATEIADAAFHEVVEHFRVHEWPCAEAQYGEAESLLRDGWVPGLGTWWNE